MIVDTHAHIFSAAGPFLEGARYKPSYEARVEQWLDLWPECGVTQGVLVQPSFLGADNSLLLASVQARSDVLRGVVVVRPSVPSAVLRKWDAEGVRGVRLNLLGIADLSRYATQEWMALYGLMAELGWHLEIQCEGERYPGFLPLLKEVPLTLVIDHFGLPDPLAKGTCDGTSAILHEAGRRPLYVKLSAPYRLRGARADLYATLFLSELGPRNLLWGSDWPWTNHENGRSYAEGLELLGECVSSPEELAIILGVAPKRLYGF